MCSLKVLVKNDSNFIAHCPKCKHVQAIIDTTAARFSMSEFAQFYYLVIKTTKEIDLYDKLAHHFISLPSEKFALVLPVEKNLLLAEDMDDAYGVLEFYQILNGKDAIR